MFRELIIWNSKSIFVSACLMIALLGIEIRCNAAYLPPSQGSRNADQAETISSQDELAKVIAALDHPETRLKALAKLIRFASYKLYQVGSITIINSDSRIDDLQKRAADAIWKQINIETIEEALDSNDPKLQFWGVFFWKGVSGSQDSASDEWMSLLPKIKKLAIEGDGSTRYRAIERLQDFPECREFLAKRVQVETSPDILMKLVYHPDKAEFSKRLNPLLLSLLDHTDEEVRCYALYFIDFNRYRAPMWQIDFDRSILDKTLEKTLTESERERAAAASALREIRSLDLNRSREAFIRLAEDDSENVRSRVAWGLAGQFQLEDVKAVIANLLKDPSPLGQYMTILAVGPENFLKELERLAQVSDRRISEWASAKLKQLSENKKAK